MAERQIGEGDFAEVSASGKTVEGYAEDKPYPSHLVLRWVKGPPIHVLAPLRSMK
jgi:hypothetical protein